MIATLVGPWSPRGRRAANAPAATPPPRSAAPVAVDVAAGVAEQAACGLDLLTLPLPPGAGDLAGWFASGLGGVAPSHSGDGGSARLLAHGPLEWTRPITVETWRAASEQSPRPLKAVLPGPFTLASQVQDAHYGDPRALTLALAAAIHAEMRALAAAGVPLIELDEPTLVRHKDEWPLAREAIALAASEHNAPVALAVWGGDVADLDGFLALPVQAFLLDFVGGPRNWPLVDRFPSQPALGLGIVSATDFNLEAADSLGNVLWRVTQTFSPRRLHVHPAGPLDALTAEQAAAKLQRVAEVVRAAQNAGT